jgi:succinate dehydrogenase / fumarate reductase flavoprotein subunit
MSESLRNDGRIWVPAKLEDATASVKGRKKTELSEEDRDYYLEKVSFFWNLVPRDVASRAAKKEVMLVLELIKQEKQFI